MTSVAVSGASGFVGSQLCPELAARGHRVALSRAQLQSPELATALSGIETVVHLAARAHVLHEVRADPLAEFIRCNVGLTQVLGTAARRAGVKRFIFVSSAGVLGARSPPEGFSEESPPHPHDPYTASKLQAEQWLNTELRAWMELAILRPPLIYGAGARGNFARLLRLAVRGWPLPLGALRAPRSLVGVRNLVDLICALVARAAPAQATMLVADRETISVAELFQTIARFANHRPWLAPVPATFIRSMLAMAGRGDDVMRLTEPFVLRPRIAQLQFNWVPPHSQRDEILRTVVDELAAMRMEADRRKSEAR
jgi:nucleoside-diphosphate-sugar epimerase